MGRGSFSACPRCGCASLSAGFGIARANCLSACSRHWNAVSVRSIAVGISGDHVDSFLWHIRLPWGIWSWLDPLHCPGSPCTLLLLRPPFPAACDACLAAIRAVWRPWKARVFALTHRRDAGCPLLFPPRLSCLSVDTFYKPCQHQGLDGQWFSKERQSPVPSIVELKMVWTPPSFIIDVLGPDSSNFEVSSWMWYNKEISPIS